MTRVRRAFLLSKATLLAALVGLSSMILGSMLTASCGSPGFDFPAGDGGEGGQGPVAAHCDNGRKDGDETDLDCGGSVCDPCRVGSSCVTHRDCENESCISKVCQNASCMDGVLNYDETDTDCGGQNCGPTCEAGAACVDHDDCRSFHCEAGLCQAPTCDDRILNGDETGTDCGGSCEGCPVGDPCVVSGDCEAPPDGDPAAVECAEGLCELNCPDDTGDCNERADDGCEVDLLTSNNHCGACDLECDPAHATGECIGGECRIKTDEPNQGCDSDYANCNLLPEDGCEANLLTDPDHCGACEDSACSTSGGVASCGSGECSIECDEGYSDCDENARDNGCEINTSNNIDNCGECGSACEVSSPDYTAFCTEGVCGETLCEDGKGDCDGDGNCTDSLATVTNCGGCGLACTVAHGSPHCVISTDETACAIDVCDATDDESWADCDGSYVTGCEVNTRSNRFRCGGCLSDEGGSGEDCSLKEGTENVTATACSAGDCQIVGCAGGFGDCDGVFSNGCETNLDTSAAYCGACNIDCTDKVGEDSVAAVTCQSGSCQVGNCSGNREDCDGNFGNGCEVNPNTNETHCGGCNDASGTSCNAEIDEDDVTGVQCDAGVCVVTTCEPNRADCDDTFGNGCEVNTNTDETHCGGCAGEGGVTCEARPHATVACQSGSCEYTCDTGWDDPNDDRNQATGSDGCESRELVIKNYGTWGSSDTGGSGPPATFTHTLQGSPGSYRLILVGVVCRGETANDCALTTATYDSTPLSLLGEVFLVDSSAKIYYALDSALPAAGTYTVTLNRNDNWGSITGDVIEFGGAEQQTFYSDQGSDSNDVACASSTDTVVSLSGLAPGTIVYAVGGGNSLGGMTTAGGGLTLANSQYANYLLLGSGYSDPVSGSASPALDFSGCDRSVMYAVGVRPESDY